MQFVHVAKLCCLNMHIGCIVFYIAISKTKLASCQHLNGPPATFSLKCKWLPTFEVEQRTCVRFAQVNRMNSSAIVPNSQSTLHSGAFHSKCLIPDFFYIWTFRVKHRNWEAAASDHSQNAGPFSLAPIPLSPDLDASSGLHAR